MSQHNQIDATRSQSTSERLTLRYVAYATANRKTPAEMMAHDEQEFPGGKMCGFTLWISAQWRAWQKATDRRNLDMLTEADHASFDAFIISTVAVAA